MGRQLITAPATEPVSLAEAKEQLSISDSVQDAVITRHIIAARNYAENYIGGALITQTWEQVLDHFPAEVELTWGPVQSITSIKYFDTASVEQTMDVADYGLDNSSPRQWVFPAYGTSWPSTLDSPNAVRIRYVAGFGDASTDVPAVIRQAILLTIGHWVNFQPQVELGGTVLMVPRQVDQLLNPYRLIRV